MKHIPVPAWQATTKFTTRLEEAGGKIYGADTRIEYRIPHLYGYIGYGYASTEYRVAQREFSTWFSDSVQRYHPPQDRRHQINALFSAEVAGVTAAARWQFGSGLPFTSPIGFDEAFDITRALPQVSTSVGTTRMLLNRPFNGRLPDVHRLDVSLERGFILPFGRFTAQIGAINAYDQQNMFYYDLYTSRRVDQLPFAPYASLTLRSGR